MSKLTKENEIIDLEPTEANEAEEVARPKENGLQKAGRWLSEQGNKKEARKREKALRKQEPKTVKDYIKTGLKAAAVVGGVLATGAVIITKLGKDGEPDLEELPEGDYEVEEPEETQETETETVEEGIE